MRTTEAVAERLEIPGTTIARYDGSFLKLRREIDPLLNDLEPPKLVVYVPVEQANTHHALVELEAAGVVMQPGQQPFKCNTRLALVARNALKNVIGDENAAEVEKQVDQGKLTLKDVDALGIKGQDITQGVVSIIFGTGNSQEVALAFLASDQARRRNREEVGDHRTGRPAAIAPSRPSYPTRPRSPTSVSGSPATS